MFIGLGFFPIGALQSQVKWIAEAAEPGGGGGIGGKCPSPFCTWGKVPFFGNESALFS